MYLAEIVVNLPVEGTYHYHIPSELAGRVKNGHLVEVAFGRQKAQGVVLGFDTFHPSFETKPIERLVDRAPIVNEPQLALARWLASTYHAPLADCVRLFIPPGLSKKGDILVSPLVDPVQISPRDDTQNRLLKLLAARGPLRGRQLARSMPRRNWRDSITDLVDRGLVLREPVLATPTVSAKQIRVASLGVAPDSVEIVISRVFDTAGIPANRRQAALRRAGILRFLAGQRSAVPVGEVYQHVDGSTINDLRILAEDDLVLLREREVWRDPLADKIFVPDTPPNLTLFQQQGWDIISQALDYDHVPPPVLLHGVTGSGKTELYLRAAAHVVARGQQAIVMVPEIALTPQTVRRFGARFPGRMGLVHSNLSQGERYDTWRRARDGQFDIIVGPRSALFAPLDNIGLIVLDECHDDSYKQGPPVAPPYYHTLPAAVELMRLYRGLVILGSATPNVTTYAASALPGEEIPGQYTLIDLPARIMGHREAIQSQALHFHVPQTRYAHQVGDPDEAVMIDLPPVRIIDMRQELRAGNRSIFSRALSEALEESLARHEQSILFLNRRGTATYVFCRSCGYVLKCPQCEIPLTWHQMRRGQGILVCHHCDYRMAHPAECPECRSDQIKYFGGGTERVETEVRKAFPDARVVRWDRDTTGSGLSHEELLEQFISHDADIMVGTQMVAKGLDLPLVTLVGVISADTALHLPDYRSSERTFQLLTQVAGRAGRGLLGGDVILQTYEPDHYAIRAAAEHNYHAFYEREMSYRQELAYPPFTRLARIEVRGSTPQEAETTSRKLHAVLRNRIAERRLLQTSLIGPAPCYYARRGNLFRWHIIIRGPDPASLLDDIRPSALVSIDIDPVAIL